MKRTMIIAILVLSCVLAVTALGGCTELTDYTEEDIKSIINAVISNAEQAPVAEQATESATDTATAQATGATATTTTPSTPTSPTAPSRVPLTPPENRIGEPAATQIAFDKLGVTAEQARFLECKLDLENGVFVYEVEFNIGNIEHEFDIDAVSGVILKQEQEIDND